jgi:hypothetical protein
LFLMHFFNRNQSIKQRASSHQVWTEKEWRASTKRRISNLQGDGWIMLSTTLKSMQKYPRLFLLTLCLL